MDPVQFTLVVSRDIPLTGEELVRLRPYGCVLISRREDGNGAAVFETASVSYFDAVDAAIDAVESLGARVLEITGEPVRLRGVRIATTVTRDQWGRRSPPHRGWKERARSSRYRWWPLYGFVVAMFLAVLFAGATFAKVMLYAGAALGLVLLAVRILGGDSRA